MVIAVSGKAARPLFPRRKKCRRRHSASRQMTQRVHRIATCLKLPARPSNNRERIVSPSASLRRPTVRPAISHTQTQTHRPPDRRKQFLLFLCRAFDGRDGMLSAAFKISLSLLALTFIIPSACAPRDRRLRLNASQNRAGWIPRRSHLLMTMRSQCLPGLRAKIGNNIIILMSSIEH